MRKNQFMDEHVVNIFKAALPHVGAQTQSSLNVILKANELMSSLQEISNPGELSAMDIGNEQRDPERLLTSIRPACLPAEAEVVDMILNFIKARKIFNVYQSYNQNILKTAEMDRNKRTNGDRNTFMEFLKSQLSPEQRNTFEMLNMVMNSMPNDTNRKTSQETVTAQENVTSQETVTAQETVAAQDS